MPLLAMIVLTALQIWQLLAASRFLCTSWAG
jgi:hypothetical protein